MNLVLKKLNMNLANLFCLVCEIGSTFFLKLRFIKSNFYKSLKLSLVIFTSLKIVLENFVESVSNAPDFFVTNSTLKWFKLLKRLVYTFVVNTMWKRFLTLKEITSNFEINFFREDLKMIKIHVKVLFLLKTKFLTELLTTYYWSRKRISNIVIDYLLLIKESNRNALLLLNKLAKKKHIFDLKLLLKRVTVIQVGRSGVQILKLLIKVRFRVSPVDVPNMMFFR